MKADKKKRARITAKKEEVRPVRTVPIYPFPVRKEGEKKKKRAALWFAAILALGCVLPGEAQAEEASGIAAAALSEEESAAAGASSGRAQSAASSLSALIYHRHTGNERQEGGCYHIPVLHMHEGDSAAGGGCFTKAVLHSHGENCYQGDELRCDREGETERYEADCGHTEGEVERYAPDCGMQERTPVAAFTLSADTREWTRKVTLKASYEKLGEVTIFPDCYVWDGKTGSSDTVEVTENGLHTCALNCSEDSTAQDTVLGLQISNIDRTGPTILGFENLPEEWTNEPVKVKILAVDVQPQDDWH